MNIGLFLGGQYPFKFGLIFCKGKHSCDFVTVFSAAEVVSELVVVLLQCLKSRHCTTANLTDKNKIRKDKWAALIFLVFTERNE